MDIHVLLSSKSTSKKIETYFKHLLLFSARDGASAYATGHLISLKNRVPYST